MLLLLFFSHRKNRRIKLLDKHLEELSDFTAKEWIFSINGYNGLAYSDDSLCYLYISTNGDAHHKIIERNGLINAQINRVANLRTTSRVDLQLFINDDEMPTRNIILFDHGLLNEGMDNRLVDFDPGVQKAIHWHALLQVFMKNGEHK